MMFGASLYTHNIQVSFLAFSLGALTIVLGMVILFYNGVILGASARCTCWTTSRSSSSPGSVRTARWSCRRSSSAAQRVWSWAARCSCPADLSRGASLRRVLPSVWRMIIGAALTLVLAGLIEGSFSQFSAKTIPYALKIAVAVLLFIGLTTYLFLRRTGAT